LRLRLYLRSRLRLKLRFHNNCALAPEPSEFSRVQTFGWEPTVSCVSNTWPAGQPIWCLRYFNSRATYLVSQALHQQGDAECSSTTNCATTQSCEVGRGIQQRNHSCISNNCSSVQWCCLPCFGPGIHDSTCAAQINSTRSSVVSMCRCSY
jgi:hypothetical protein